MSDRELARVLRVPGAVLLGLGSILGTGVYVSLGIAAGITGPSVLAAIAIAATVATCNGLSSAQLAASHPVSGGTYEYGYRYLHPTLGFTAGWMFLCAKSASAATAALGSAGYVLASFGIHGTLPRIALGIAGVVVLTVLAAGGIQRGSRTNAIIVGITLIALIAFVVAGMPSAIARAPESLAPFFRGDARDLLHATALVFVAFTGYARIATLGEEVHEPKRSIPIAIIVALGVTMLIYVGVAFVLVSVGVSHNEAELEHAAARFGVPFLPSIVALGAVTAMLGVVLNLLLGLSRVLLAMARRRDVPPALATLHDGSPRRAVIATGILVAALVAIGNVETTWSFSAFTVLVYYAITNLAALRLPQQLVFRVLSTLGLIACLGLAFWVEPQVWALGLGLVLVGLVWHRIAESLRRA